MILNNIKNKTSIVKIHNQIKYQQEVLTHARFNQYASNNTNLIETSTTFIHSKKCDHHPMYNINHITYDLLE